jgi:hypothetical protein
MPFTGRPAAANVEVQQRVVLNEILTGVFLRACGGENEKGRREAGLSLF